MNAQQQREAAAAAMAELGRHARLTVCIDLHCPWSWLALAPTLTWLENAGIACDAHAAPGRVRWLPFHGTTLRPPPPPRPPEDRGTRHRRIRAEYLEHNLRRDAAARNLPLARLYSEATTPAADGALLWLQQQHPASVPRALGSLFGAYWDGRLDAGDAFAVAQALADTGVPCDALPDWLIAEGTAARSAATAQVDALGVFRSPAYVLDGDIFLGREHLPLLAGRWAHGGAAAG